MHGNPGGILTRSRVCAAVASVRDWRPCLRMSDSIRCPSQSFTSNRRMEDQFPGLPEVSLARARHHIVRVGRVLLLN
jgi:hypothetical protein